MEKYVAFHLVYNKFKKQVNNFVEKDSLNSKQYNASQDKYNSYHKNNSKVHNKEENENE